MPYYKTRIKLSILVLSINIPTVVGIMRRRHNYEHGIYLKLIVIDLHIYNKPALEELSGTRELSGRRTWLK